VTRAPRFGHLEAAELFVHARGRAIFSEEGLGYNRLLGTADLSRRSLFALLQLRVFPVNRWGYFSLAEGTYRTAGRLVNKFFWGSVIANAAIA
jgi:hypothetical protein